MGQAQGSSYWIKKGKSYNKQSKWDEAIECFEKAIRIKPDYTAYYNKDLTLSLLGRKSGGIESYNKAKSFKSDYAWAYYNKGVTLSKSGRKNEAIEYFDVTIRFQPDYADAYYNKGKALNRLGRKNEAIECYDTAIKLMLMPTIIKAEFLII